jgi:adenosylcobinamide-GDP ribazoletransferase
VAIRIPRRSRTATGSADRPGGTVRAAIGLLTRLPVSFDDPGVSGAAAFPLVGLLVGVAGAVPLLLVGALAAEPALAGLLAIAAMTTLTGALHLDGLADTADALLAADTAGAERARKDPAIGPGGAVALILVLGIEVAALASLLSSAGAAVAAASLVVAAIVGRTLPIAAIVLTPARAASGGFGAWFAAGVRPADALIASVLAIAIIGGLALAIGSPVIAVGGVVGAVAGLVMAGAIVAGRRQLDGDGMGAIVELTVAATLLAAAVVA